MKYIVLIFFLFFINKMYPQDSLSFTYFDKLTYDNYSKAEWHELIKNGKLALKNNYDYYYLRLRLGIAYYNSENYPKAIKSFEKALEFNNDDALTIEYLYYSNLYIGNKYKANKYYQLLPKSKKEIISKKIEYFIKSIYFEGGYGSNLDYKSQSKSIIGKDKALVQRNITKNTYFDNLSLTHKLGKYSEAVHSYSGLKLNWQQQYKDNNLDTRQYLHFTSQNQYYIGLNFKNKNRFSLLLAAHYIWINTNYNTFTVDFTNIPGSYIFKNNNYKSKERAYLIGLNKEWNYFSISTSISFSNLNSQKQIQPTICLVYFPKANKNIYLSSAISKVLLRPNQINLSNSITIRGKIGLKISKIWIEGSATYGTMYNYIENNGYSINNDVDRIIFRSGLNIIVPIKNKQIYLNYSYQKKEGDIYNYYFNQNYNEEKYLYNLNNLSIGIKFNL